MIDEKTLQTLLKNLGFTQKEGLVYLTLLELNEAIPSTIARKTGLKRPTVYLTLDQLQKKGLASSVKKTGTLYYRITPPQIFLEKEQAKTKDRQAVLNTLENALPELAALHKQYAATPQMSVFYGKEGLIQIMEDSLTADKEILCWSNTDLAVNTLLKDYHPFYVEKKIARNIWSKCLFLKDKIGLGFKKRSKKELREVRFLPKDQPVFSNEINIYNDKVSIISHEDQVGVIIQNENIANTQRAIFEMCFKFCKN